MIEKYEIEVQFGYWEPTQNDGRYVCHKNKPDWWKDGMRLHGISVNYGWGARFLPTPHGEDYWTGFGETKGEAISNLFADSGGNSLLSDEEEAIPCES